jgi:hypothetical protein
MTQTIIVSNGSKWLGEAPDTIETLLAVLAQEPLDHTFERYGNFITPLTEQTLIAPQRHPELLGLTEFWGNFARVSHVFCIRTNDPAVIATLTAAIRQNQDRDDYGPNGNIR